MFPLLIYLNITRKIAPTSLRKKQYKQIHLSQKLNIVLHSGS